MQSRTASAEEAFPPNPILDVGPCVTHPLSQHAVRCWSDLSTTETSFTSTPTSTSTYRSATLCFDEVVYVLLQRLEQHSAPPMPTAAMKAFPRQSSRGGYAPTARPGASGVWRPGRLNSAQKRRVASSRSGSVTESVVLSALNEGWRSGQASTS